MLGQCLVPSLTKKNYFLLVGSEKTAIYSPLNTIFNEVFQCILKSLEAILIRNYISIAMPKNKNKTEKTWTKFDLTSNTLLEKY